MASRSRLVQQLLAESLLLALLSAGFGLLLTVWLAEIINRVPLPASIPIEVQLIPDVRLLACTLLLAAASTLLSGLAPALRATRADLAPALKREEPRSGRRLTLRNALVVGQVAVSLVLLVGAFLFLRSLRILMQTDPGFDVAGTLSARVNATGALPKLFVEQARSRVQALPGVVAASYVAILPLSFSAAGAEIRIEDGPAEGIPAGVNAVGPRYFETMRIPLLRGREFRSSDREGAPPVALINETFARRHFAGQDPVGQRLVYGRGDARQVLEIVGVARDSKSRTLGEDPAPFVYRSYLQPPAIRRHPILLARTAGGASSGPRAVVSAVKQVIGELAPSALVEARTIEDTVGFALFPSRFGAVLVGSLGALGVLLAMVGLYGVMAYAVARRTSEIGIRMALGASPGAVRRMILADGLLLVVAGVAIGLAISLVVTQPLAMFLAAGVGPTDPISFASVAALLVLAGLGACLVPARRAMRVDPMVALRYE